MRAVIVVTAVVLAGITTAEAKKKIVVMEPTVVRACRSNANWPAALACMGKLGHVFNQRSVGGGRVVQMSGDNAGTFLFVQRTPTGPWTIGGIYNTDHAQILDFAPLVVNKHTGYLIKLGTVGDVEIPLDADHTITGRQRETVALICGGDSYYCETAVLACDASRGQHTYFTFHGTLRLEGNEVHVDGDRSRGGTTCVSTERFFLGWGPTTN